MNILAMLYSAMFLCLAMPELPPDTIAELQLVQGQAENLTLAEQGVQPYDQITAQNQTNLTNILLLFQGLYRGLQAWNSWAGGDDYIIQKQYVVERTDLPEWLADYSGDVIFWELEYFGHTIQMMTDKYGFIINWSGKKAVNVYIKNNMRDASAKYKAENPNPGKMLKPQGQLSYNESDLAVPSNNSVFNLEKPFISGRGLQFTIYIAGNPHRILLEDFTNTVIASNSMTTWNLVYVPFFKVDQGQNHAFVFRDLTTGETIETGTYAGASYPNFPTSLLASRNYGNPGDIMYFLPLSYYTFNRGSVALKFKTGNLVSAFGLGNSVQFAAINGQGPYSEGAPYGLYLSESAGQTVSSTSNIVIPSNGGISADSLEEIQASISEIIPETDPTTGIEDLPIPDAFPEAEIVPLEPEPGPIPDGPVYPEFDFPIGDPEQVPESDPETAPTTAPTEISIPDNAEDIPVPDTLSVVNGLQNRFPFSIPWDIYNALSNLSAERQIPHWEWTMNVSMPFSDEVFSYTFVLDLGFMAGTVGLFRNLFLLAFILGLAVYSYNKFFGGGA